MSWFTGFLSGASAMANAVFLYAVDSEVKKRDELEKKYKALLLDFNESKRENSRLHEELLRETRNHVDDFRIMDSSNVLHVQLMLDELISDFDGCLAKVQAEVTDYVNRLDDDEWNDGVVHVLLDAYCHDVFLFSSNVVFTFNNSERANEEIHWFMNNFNPDMLSTNNDINEDGEKNE